MNGHNVVVIARLDLLYSRSYCYVNIDSLSSRYELHPWSLESRDDFSSRASKTTLYPAVKSCSIYRPHRKYLSEPAGTRAS
jgi:hypothetical protein